MKQIKQKHTAQATTSNQESEESDKAPFDREFGAEVALH